MLENCVLCIGILILLKDELARTDIWHLAIVVTEAHQYNGFH